MVCIKDMILCLEALISGLRSAREDSAANLTPKLNNGLQ
jgi:hypothetical protein